jgi:hypothetical protein
LQFHLTRLHKVPPCFTLPWVHLCPVFFNNLICGTLVMGRYQVLNIFNFLNTNFVVF